MKTSEFIKMLQEADPSGEAHVRLSDGVPIYAELKPGYWDGPYDYISEDGFFTKSIRGNKVDICTIDVSSIVWDSDWNKWKESREDFVNRVKSQFKFELEGYSNGGADRIKARFDEIEKIAKDYMEFEEKDSEKWLKEVVDNSKLGYRFYQPVNPKMKYHDMLIVDPEGKTTSSNFGTSNIILNSGFFEQSSSPVKTSKIKIKFQSFFRKDNNRLLKEYDEFYEWKLKDISS